MAQLVFGWGQTGHRVVGEIAEKHLNDKAKERISKILNGASLAEVSNWMDDIKSDAKYDSLRSWHYVTIEDNSNYEESDKNPKGDIILGLNTIIDGLKNGKLSAKTEEEYIKILVHLIGDIHQPLHVGRGNDRGGNTIDLVWFWSKSNLHRVWDSGLIDSQKYSYTELAKVADKADSLTIINWQNSNVLDWAYESMSYRKDIYNLPSNKEINYRYRYEHWKTVETRLAQAGIRLAGILNEIYG